MFDYIIWPFAWLMRTLLSIKWVNYGLALILFSLVVNLVLTPFMAKSKRGMMRTTRLQPKLKEIQRRHEGNPQKLQQEMQKLYKEEGASPMGGCLWSLLPLFLLIPLYRIIRMPVTSMMGAPAEVLTKLGEIFKDSAIYTGAPEAYKEIALTQLVHDNWADKIVPLSGTVEGWDKLMQVDLSFLGVNLGEQPNWQTIFSGPWTWAAIGLFLIPFISAGLSWLSMKVANAANASVQDPQAQGMSKGMNIMMPLMSLAFCFMMPAAMGIYWIANSLFAMIRDFLLTKHYKKVLDREDAERLSARSERERELEAKREETERLKAEGKTEVNTNTSKKKLQASEKQQNAERRAAAERAERAARRERLGIKENEKPASQVGNRRYARGRAYVPDRYENPEHAEEATLAAAEASEGAASIDESVEEEILGAVNEEE
jgi:YidC/Oxa1 family membrane protein insertase